MTDSLILPYGCWCGRDDRVDVHRDLAVETAKDFVAAESGAEPAEDPDAVHLHLAEDIVRAAREMRTDLTDDQCFTLMIAAEIVLHGALGVLLAPRPQWSEPTTQIAQKHRVGYAGRVGWIYEYGGGRCWARAEKPDRKLGSFPDLETARAAVVAELTKI